MQWRTLILLSFLATPLQAQHNRGNLALSIGGSLSHTFNKDRELNIYAEVTDEYYDDAPVSESEDYEDVDLSLFFSAGYFVVKGLELGISGSLMQTWYTKDAQEDLEIYDVQAHSKYYFDNETEWTPYAKINGGLSTITTGDYNEEDAVAGGALGLEFSGFGPFAWYAEFSSLYTFNGGDVTGDEWRNQIYFGVSYYIDLLAKRKRREAQERQAKTLHEQTDAIWGSLFDRIDSMLDGQ